MYFSFPNQIKSKQMLSVDQFQPRVTLFGVSHQELQRLDEPKQFYVNQAFVFADNAQHFQQYIFLFSAR